MGGAEESWLRPGSPTPPAQFLRSSRLTSEKGASDSIPQGLWGLGLLTWVIFRKKRLGAGKEGLSQSLCGDYRSCGCGELLWDWAADGWGLGLSQDQGKPPG